MLLGLGAWAAACGSTDPYFESVLLPRDTDQVQGPHLVEAWVVAPEGVGRLSLRLADGPSLDAGGDVASHPFVELPFSLVRGDQEHGLWQYALPGRPAGTWYLYYLFLADTDGAVVRYPQHAPDLTGLLQLRLLAPDS